MAERTRNVSIRNWPEGERPREKLIRFGAESLTDAELLAIILRVGNQGSSAIDMGRQLVGQLNGLSGLDRAHVEDIRKIKGLGIAKTAQIKAAIEIGKRVRRQNAMPVSFDSAAAIARFCAPKFEGKRHEQFIALLLDGQNQLLAERIISEGIPTQAVIYTRKVMEEALRVSASGSGGFLIRVFEIVREQILADVDREYNAFKKTVDQDASLDDEERAVKLRDRFDALQKTIDQGNEGSRLWKLSNRCIYGTDANDRMARTSKMNMIMHGDGHGGVHHHDGFLNVNGIFEGRFDVILTNPPFGANVEPSDKITEEEITVSADSTRRYTREYGELYTAAQARVQAALDKPIASLFELPKSPHSRIKTEILFIERCLDLLRPGGRLGIVLPEGIFNNPSLAYVREFTENRAFLMAVVSLPQDTFVSSGASVKCSLLFLQKFTDAEKATFAAAAEQARQEIDARHAAEIVAESSRLEAAIAAAKDSKDTQSRKALQAELKAYLRSMDARKSAEARQLLKQHFDYPIFMYEAEHVGITATGEDDANELFPNDRQPDGGGKTCLEWYREFLADPQAFAKAVEGE